MTVREAIRPKIRARWRLFRPRPAPLLRSAPLPDTAPFQVAFSPLVSMVEVVPAVLQDNLDQVVLEEEVQVEVDLEMEPRLVLMRMKKMMNHLLC